MQNLFYRQYTPVIQILILLLSCLLLGACSKGSSDSVYAQYTQICQIIAEQYGNFTKTSQTSGDIAILYSKLETEIGDKIPDKHVRESFFSLFKNRTENPYQVFKQVIKQRTGRDYNCKAFVKLTEIKAKSD